MPLKLSVSGADTWQTCNRKYYYAYQARRIPKDKAPELTFGSAWHSFRDGTNDTHGLTGVELLKLRVLNEAYIKHWKDEPLDIVACEEEFALPGFNGDGLDPDLLVCGRIDGRERNRLVEYKTTSSYIDAGSMYWERILDDRQIQTYLGALWSQGHTFNDVLYDVARKPMIKRKTKETLEDFGKRLQDTIALDPEGYFQRRVFTFTEDQVSDTWRDLHVIGQQIPHDDDMKHYPKAPRSCHAYGRPCEYLGVCRGAESIDDDNLFTAKKPT